MRPTDMTLPDMLVFFCEYFLTPFFVARREAPRMVGNIVKAMWLAHDEYGPDFVLWDTLASYGDWYNLEDSVAGMNVREMSAMFRARMNEVILAEELADERIDRLDGILG